MKNIKRQYKTEKGFRKGIKDCKSMGMMLMDSCNCEYKFFDSRNNQIVLVQYVL